MTRPCRLCGEPIELVTTDRGRQLALDIGHHPDGTIDIDPDGTARTASFAALSDPEWPLRRKHAASCAARERRRGHDHTQRGT